MNLFLRFFLSQLSLFRMPGPTRYLMTYSKREIKQRIACRNVLQCSNFSNVRSLRDSYQLLSVVCLTNFFLGLHNPAVRQNSAFFDENDQVPDIAFYQEIAPYKFVPLVLPANIIYVTKNHIHR